MFELFLILLVLAFPIGIAIGWWIFYGRPKQQAASLKNKFTSLGNLMGKTRAQIEGVVGAPDSWVAVDENKVNCTWRSSAYWLVLQFESDVCKGVVAEMNF